MSAASSLPVSGPPPTLAAPRRLWSEGVKAREELEAKGRGRFGKANRAEWRKKFELLGVDLPDDDSEWFQAPGPTPGAACACHMPRTARPDASSGGPQHLS